MYPIYFALGATTAHFFLQYRKNYWAERDAVMRHYVQLHPEDFPPPGKVGTLSGQSFFTNRLSKKLCQVYT